MIFREHPQRAIQETCDLRLDTCDTEYISDNWERQYQQLHCDLWIKSDGDRIGNSCNVFLIWTFCILDKDFIVCPPLMQLMMMAWCLMGIWECSRRAQQASGGQCVAGRVYICNFSTVLLPEFVFATFVTQCAKVATFRKIYSNHIFNCLGKWNQLQLFL